MTTRTKLFSVPVRCYWDECWEVWHDHPVYVSSFKFLWTGFAEGSPIEIIAAEVEALRKSLPARWREYDEYVKATGRDPLHEVPAAEREIA